MRRAGIAFFFVSSVWACGGGQPQTHGENVQLDKPDAAAVALPNGPVQPIGIPHDAPFVASFDATAFATILPLRLEIERALDIPQNALLEQASALGFDTKRPVTLAVAPLDEAQTKLVGELRQAFKDPSAQPNDEVIKRILSIESPIVIRLLVPATNAQKLEQTIGKFLEGDRWHKTAGGWTKHGEHVFFDDDGQNVAVDFIVAHAHAGDPKGYRAFAARAHDPAPSLGGRTMHATWTPRAVTEIGYLSGVIKAAGAVSGESVDPAQRVRIMREGLTEAEEGFALATFDRVDVDAKLSPFELVGRAKPGAGFAIPPADAFAQSTAIALPSGGVAIAQASRAFVRGWPYPGGSAKTALQAMRDGGSGAILAGIPHLLAMLPLIESRRDRTAAPFDLSRFERVGTVFDQGSETTYVSVMPLSAKRADAECAFAPKTPCDAKMRLKLNAIVKIDELNAKLHQIDKRFVIVSSESDSAKLDAPKLTQAGGMRVDADTSLISRFLAPSTLPANITGEITSEDGTLVFRAH